MNFLKRLMIWTRIGKLEQDFKTGKVDLEHLRKMVDKPSEPGWGINPELRRLREIIEGTGETQC